MSTWILPGYYMDVWLNLMYDNKLEHNYTRLDLLYRFYSLICYYTIVIHLKISLYLRIVHYNFVIIYIENVYYILKVIVLVFKLDDYSSVYLLRYPYISSLHFLPFYVIVRFRDYCLPRLSASKSVLTWWTSCLNLSRSLDSFLCFLSSKPFWDRFTFG